MKKSERAKLQKVKARAKKAAEEAKTKKRSLGEIAEHGMRTNTIKYGLFTSLQKKAKTLKEACSESWNVNQKPQGGYAAEFIKAGIAAKLDDGRMFIIGSKADPNSEKKKKKKKK